MNDTTDKMNHTPTYCGVDIAKATIDAHAPESGKVTTYPNTLRGCRAAFTHMTPKHGGPIHIVAEPTGGYERTLLQAAREENIPISLPNPLQVRDYARGKGILHKTDPQDAQVLSCFGRANLPRPLPPEDPLRERLAALTKRREQLIATLTAECNRLEKQPCPEVAADIRSLQRVLRGRITKIDHAIAAQIQDDDRLAALEKRLVAVVGIGPVAATALLAHMPELGKISGNQAAALVGVAPMNWDSGQMQGRRTIMRGRAQLRRVLFMAARTAAVHNHVLAPFYQRLRAAGKGYKQAIIAVTRKIVRLVNRIAADPDFKLSASP